MLRLWIVGFVLPILAFAQDSRSNLKTVPAQPAFESGRNLFGTAPAAALELRPVPGEYVVFVMQGARDVLQVGDRFGSERYLVLAISKNRVLFQRVEGFGLMYRDKSGKTVIENIDRANLTPEFFEMVRKPE